MVGSIWLSVSLLFIFRLLKYILLYIVLNITSDNNVMFWDHRISQYTNRHDISMLKYCFQNTTLDYFCLIDLTRFSQKLSTWSLSLMFMHSLLITTRDLYRNKLFQFTNIFSEYGFVETLITYCLFFPR